MKRHYITGLLAGWALWLALVGVERIYSVQVTDVPKAVRAVTDPVMTAVGLAVWPLALGGWFLWGEGAHLSPAANIVIGLVLWGALGVLAARWQRRDRLSRTA